MILQVIEDGSNASDLATVCISIAALAVSLVTLFYQFFYQKWEMILQLLKTRMSDDKSKITLSYLISNSGNRDLVLTGVKLYGGDSTKGTAHESYSPLACKCEGTPVTLKPQDIKLLDAEVEVRDLAPTPRHKKIFIRVVIITSAGKQREFLHEVTHIDEPTKAPALKYYILYRITNFYNVDEAEI